MSLQTPESGLGVCLALEGWSEELSQHYPFRSHTFFFKAPNFMLAQTLTERVV